MPDVEKMSSQDKTKEITERLEKGIMELFEGDKFKEYLNTMSKFHNYSFNNAVENADIAAERKNNTADIVADKPKAYEPSKMNKKPSILEQIKTLKSVGKVQTEPKPLVKGKENEI